MPFTVLSPAPAPCPSSLQPHSRPPFQEGITSHSQLASSSREDQDGVGLGVETLLGDEKLGLLTCFVLVASGVSGSIAGSPLLYVIR